MSVDPSSSSPTPQDLNALLDKRAQGEYLTYCIKMRWSLQLVAGGIVLEQDGHGVDLLQDSASPLQTRV
eukprot:2228983-Amphidinium_carterae.1